MRGGGWSKWLLWLFKLQSWAINTEGDANSSSWSTMPDSSLICPITEPDAEFGLVQDQDARCQRPKANMRTWPPKLETQNSVSYSKLQGFSWIGKCNSVVDRNKAKLSHTATPLVHRNPIWAGSTRVLPRRQENKEWSFRARSLDSATPPVWCSAAIPHQTPFKGQHGCRRPTIEACILVYVCCALDSRSALFQVAQFGATQQLPNLQQGFVCLCAFLSQIRLIHAHRWCQFTNATQFESYAVQKL